MITDIFRSGTNFISLRILFLLEHAKSDGRTVLQVNTLQLMESHFRFKITISAMTSFHGHFMQKSAATWRVKRH